MPDEQHIVVDQNVDAGHALVWSMPVCAYYENVWYPKRFG
jgi:hypothetical protein